MAVSPVNAPTHSLVSRPVKAGGGTHGTPPVSWESLLAIVLCDLAVLLLHCVPRVDGVVLASHTVVPTCPKSKTSSAWKTNIDIVLVLFY